MSSIVVELRLNHADKIKKKKAPQNCIQKLKISQITHILKKAIKVLLINYEPSILESRINSSKNSIMWMDHTYCLVAD